VGKRYKNLFEQIVDIDNLRDAYKKALKGGNRYTLAHLKFKENLETNLYLLQRSLMDGTYRHGEYNSFVVYEPKRRVIYSLPFRDRVIQHAINTIIEPIFEKMFYSFSYACRKERGTHKGVKDTQARIRKLSKNGQVYYLQMDFRKYFASINPSVLITQIKKKISDKKVLSLLVLFIDKNKGIPIGNLLSQLFANIYGHIFDRFVKTSLHVKSYFRYMDDTVILSNCKEELIRYQKVLQKFSGIFMKLQFSKWQINSITKPLNFLGYRITPTYKLIRKNSVVRAKRKVKYYSRTNQIDSLKMFLASWGGHLRSADSFNLKNQIKMEIRNARAN